MTNTVNNRDYIQSIQKVLNEIDTKLEKDEVTRGGMKSRGPMWLNQELKSIDQSLDLLMEDVTDYYG